MPSNLAVTTFCQSSSCMWQVNSLSTRVSASANLHQGGSCWRIHMWTSKI